MLVRDRNLKVNVDVPCKDCPTFACYWPRPFPGSFTQGQGYKTLEGAPRYVCGTREAHSCPEVRRVKFKLLRVYARQSKIMQQQVKDCPFGFEEIVYKDHSLFIPRGFLWCRTLPSGQVYVSLLKPDASDESLYSDDVCVAVVKYTGDWQTSLQKVVPYLTPN